MAETAVAPPPVVPTPVAPPSTTLAGQAPGMPQIVTDPVPVTRNIVNSNPVAQVDDHVATGNAPALDSFAQKYKNTPEGQAAAELAARVKKGQDEAAKIFQGLDPNTPEGRLKALQTYKTVKDEPRYGDALMMYIAGDKQGAVQMIMGGKVTTSIEYLPNTGRMVIKKTNALGQPVSVEDAQSGQIIPMQEYAKLGGSVSSLENTLKYQSDKATQEFRTKEFNNATKAFNAIDTAAKAKDPILQNYTKLMEEIYNAPTFTMEDRRLFAGFVTGQTEFSRNFGDAKQFIDSASRTKGETLSLENRKALGLKADGKIDRSELEAALAAHGDVTLKDTAGNSYSANTLLQAMRSKSVSEGISKNVSSNRQALEESALATLYKDNPELFNKMKLALDLNGQLQAINAQSAADHGNPLFTVATTAAGFADPAQKVLAQAVQEKFNIEVTQEFNRWRKQQIDMARQAGAVDYYPEPGELESKFTDTPYYKNKQKEARNEIIRQINRPYKIGETATTNNIPIESPAIRPAEVKAVPTSIVGDGSPSKDLTAEDAKKKQAARDAARKAHTR